MPETFLRPILVFKLVCCFGHKPYRPKQKPPLKGYLQELLEGPTESLLQGRYLENPWVGLEGLIGKT